MTVSLTPEDQTLLVRRLVKRLEDPRLRASLMADGRAREEAIYALANELHPTDMDQLTQYLVIAEKALAEAGLISQVSHQIAPLPPQPLHKPRAVHEFLRDYHVVAEALDRECRQSVRQPLAGRLAAGLREALLVAALIIDCGTLSPKELRAGLRSMAREGIIVMRGLYYANAPHAEAGGEIRDARRIWLSERTVALASGLTREEMEKIANHLPRAMKPLARSLDMPRLNPSRLMLAAAAHVEHELLAPLWLLLWMQHRSGVYSSALVEDCLARVNGLKPRQPGTMAGCSSQDPPKPDPADPITSSQDQDPDHEEDASDDAEEAAEASQEGFGRIGPILRSAAGKADAEAKLRELDPTIRQEAARHPAMLELYEWLMHLLSLPLKPSTIRQNFHSVASRLLALCPTQSLSSLTREDWLFVAEEIVDTGLAASTYSNVSNALNKVASYLGQDLRLPTMTPVALANAWILSPSQLQAALEFCESERGRIPADYREAAKGLLNLAAHTGLRRQEALNLVGDNIRGGKPPLLQVRNSAWSSLKTRSSERDVYLELIGLYSNRPDLPSTAPLGHLLIRPEGNTELPPGSDAHRRFGEELVRCVHRVLTTVTKGEVTLHSLRHTAATQVFLALMADRFQLYRLTEQLPFLEDVLAPEAVAEIRRLLCPDSYVDSLELEIVRDLLGHSSAAMTLAHYIHALDILRLGMLSPMWSRDIEVIGGAAGLSAYKIRHASLSSLMDQVCRNSLLPITPLEPDTQKPYRLSSDRTHDHLVDMALLIKCSSREELEAALVKSGRHPSREYWSAARARLREIEPHALRLKSNKSQANCLLDLHPDVTPEVIIQLCDHLFDGEEGLDEDERLYHRQLLARDIGRTLRNAVTLRSGCIRLRSFEDLEAVEAVAYALTGKRANCQFFERRKQKGKLVETPIQRDKAAQLLNAAMPDYIPAGLHVILGIMPDGRERSPLVDVAWFLAAFYALYGED